MKTTLSQLRSLVDSKLLGESCTMSFSEFLNPDVVKTLFENTESMNKEELRQYMSMQIKWLTRQALRHDPPLTMKQAVDTYSAEFRRLWDQGNFELIAA
jgi:hypothetical protein